MPGLYPTAEARGAEKKVLLCEMPGAGVPAEAGDKVGVEPAGADGEGGEDVSDQRKATDGVCCACGYDGIEETPCSKRGDDGHCHHWWEGDPDKPGPGTYDHSWTASKPTGPGRIKVPEEQGG